MADNSKIIKIVGAGCAVLFLLSMCCGGGSLLWCKSMLAEPGGQAQGFLDDVRASNHSQALSRMSGAYQSSHNVQSFQQAVTTMPALSQHTGFSVKGFNVNGMSASIEGVLATPSGEVPASFLLTSMSDHWYIDSVIVGGQPLM